MYAATYFEGFFAIHQFFPIWLWFSLWADHGGHSSRLLLLFCARYRFDVLVCHARNSQARCVLKRVHKKTCLNLCVNASALERITETMSKNLAHSAEEAKQIIILLQMDTTGPRKTYPLVQANTRKRCQT